MIELIYPSVCGICNKINEEYICEECKNKLEKYLINKIIDCRKNKNVYYDYQIKILKYEKVVRENIINYKFNEKTYIYQTLEKILLNNKKIYSFLKKYDIILPVPMHKKRKWERGYNQTELIAKKLAKDLNLAVYSHVLKKIKDTKKQSTLTKLQRTQNIKGAFEITDISKIKNKNIILFDDIITTGSTLNECSRILKKAGVKEVTILTIAVD